LDETGDGEGAQQWRSIQQVLLEKRGPHQS
jgi:hypothetical protein